MSKLNNEFWTMNSITLYDLPPNNVDIVNTDGLIELLRECFDLRIGLSQYRL